MANMGMAGFNHDFKWPQRWTVHHDGSLSPAKGPTARLDWVSTTKLEQDRVWELQSLRPIQRDDTPHHHHRGVPSLRTSNDEVDDQWPQRSGAAPKYVSAYDSGGLSDDNDDIVWTITTTTTTCPIAGLSVPLTESLKLVGYLRKIRPKWFEECTQLPQQQHPRLNRPE